MQDAYIKRSTFSGPVTSLCFLDGSTLLAGQGPYLSAYDIENGNLLQQHYLGDNLRIHGIILEASIFLDDQRALIQCGKTITLLNFTARSPTSITISVLFTLSLQDWVLDVAFFNEDYKWYAAFAFAHNFVQVYELKQGKDIVKPLPHKTIRPLQHCILYSARFAPTTPRTKDHLQLACGTVMNEIWIWNVLGDSTKVLKLSGHEGVVFDLQYDVDASYLCTVSDDRTLRIWDLSEKRRSRHDPVVYWGHEARIWDVMFFEHMLISASEDSSVRLWRNPSLVANGNGIAKEFKKPSSIPQDCLAIWEGHRGKGVWSLAMNDEKRILASGGEDSGIVLWRLVSDMDDGNQQQTASPLSFISSCQPNVSIRDFQLVSPTVLVASSTCGKLLLCDMEMEEIDVLYENFTFSGYNAIKVSNCGSIAIFGNNSGDVAVVSLFGEFEAFDVHCQSEKIFSLEIWETQVADRYILLTRSPSDVVVLHELRLTMFSTAVSTLAALQLPATFIPYSYKYDPDTSLLLIGAKKGAVAMWDLASDAKEQPLGCLRRVHRQDSVTSLVIGDKQSDGSIEVYTSGRDASYAKLRAAKTDGKWTLTKVNQVYINRGWIEEVRYINGRLLLLGFHQKSMYLLDQSQGLELMSIDCGGAHRKWTLMIGDEACQDVQFIYQRNSQLWQCQRVDLAKPRQQLQASLHGREIRSSLFLREDVLVTGAENGQLLISRVGDSIDVKCRIKQVTIVRALSALQVESDVYYLFGVGAKEEIRVWRVTFDKDEIHSTLVTIGAITTPDLLIRTMACSVVSHDSRIVIMTAYSDSTIRKWKLKDNKLLLLNTTTYPGLKCILSTQSVVWNEKILLITGSTDGNIVLWDMTEMPRLLLTLDKWHQSGVNDIATRLGGNILDIASGGDDNALSTGKLDLKDMILIEQSRNPSAHASAIQGVEFHGTNILTTSWDQRLNFWDSKLELISSSFVNVADPSTMSLCEDRICIAGIGMELFKIS